MQETHSTKKDVKRWKMESGCRLFCSRGSSNAKGVLILIKQSLQVQVLDSKIDKNGRYVILKCKIGNETYTLSNIYAPNTDNPQFFTDITEQIDAFETDLKIIGGDFNLVLDLTVDKQGGIPLTHTESLKILVAYIAQNDLINVWRELNQDVRRYTWCRIHLTPIFVCLDFFLVTDTVFQSVISTDILPGFKTDHSMPIMHISLGDNSRGSGYWKFNTSLLTDKTFVDQLQKHFEIEIAQEYNETNVVCRISVHLNVILDQFLDCKFIIHYCTQFTVHKLVQNYV